MVARDGALVRLCCLDANLGIAARQGLHSIFPALQFPALQDERFFTARGNIHQLHQPRGIRRDYLHISYKKVEKTLP
jgi:hypothetical protein